MSESIKKLGKETFPNIFFPFFKKELVVFEHVCCLNFLKKKKWVSIIKFLW